MLIFKIPHKLTLLKIIFFFKKKFFLLNYTLYVSYLTVICIFRRPRLINVYTILIDINVYLNIGKNFIFREIMGQDKFILLIFLSFLAACGNYFFVVS